MDELIELLESELKHKESNSDYNNGVHDGIAHCIEILKAWYNDGLVRKRDISRP